MAENTGIDPRKYTGKYISTIMPITTNANKVFACSTITMWNKGTQSVTINGVMPLAPGEAFTFEGYPGDINMTGFNIVFTNENATGCLLICVLKEYRS